jgi:hypothetical protein
MTGEEGEIIMAKITIYLTHIKIPRHEISWLKIA